MNTSQKLAGIVGTTENICVLTGAGISAESGVPTFRSPDGLWSKFKPEELANFDAFMRNPSLVWEWYQHRRMVMHAVQPNAGHRALAELESMVKRFTLVTQNVDNLHTRAGSQKVLELHGNLERSYCVQCGHFAAETEGKELSGIPQCTRCGGMLRPDVVWFGEQLPQETFVEAEEAAGGCDLFLSVGTSAVVYPAASLPLIARDHGAYVVEINPEVTELSSVADERIAAPAGVALPELVALRRLTKEK